jgi:guanylate kinase
MKNIYLIIGPSGSGKTTIANELEKHYGLKQVQSYTTRPPRYEGERGHIFVSDEEFDALGELSAYTEFNGYRYGVTDKEIDESDIYVIDPDGAKYMADEYTGDKTIYAIRLNTRWRYCYQRMLERGDTHEEAVKRIEHDLKVFGDAENDIHYDLVLPNKDLELSIACIWAFIQCCESKYEQTAT